ncbi:MAG TPA: hypothetical protein VLY63_28815 [Anaerolineae bacterium]|nr:hypothetical protein [Anaerolineae bacterium]
MLYLICMTVYSAGRFVIAIWQPETPLLAVFKPTQAIALTVAVLGILFLVLRTRQAAAVART